MRLGRRLDEIIKFVPVLTIVGVAISFAIGLFQWLDQRRREQEQKTYEAFHKMVCLASGVDENGRVIKMSQQLAAVYQLQLYKKYSFASIPVLRLMQFEYQNHQGDSRSAHMDKAISETIELLLRD